MGISAIPAPSAASKTRFVETFTSGSLYTVPADVTYVNVTLIGAGGGGGGSGAAAGRNSQQGLGGQIVTTKVDTTPAATVVYSIGSGGTGGAANTVGGTGGSTTFTGATTALGGLGGMRGNNSSVKASNSRQGLVSDNGGGGNAGTSATGGDEGGDGGNGQIIVEYWKQEIIMERKFAVIEDNKVVNVVVGVEEKIVAANPNKYFEYTNGWDYNNGIDGKDFFPLPVVEEPTE